MQFKGFFPRLLKPDVRCFGCRTCKYEVFEDDFPNFFLLTKYQVLSYETFKEVLSKPVSMSVTQRPFAEVLADFRLRNSGTKPQKKVKF